MLFCTVRYSYRFVLVELGLLTKVMDLSLYFNQLTGQIPSELGLLTSVDFLGLANNQLMGSIPEELLTLQPSLFGLTLEGNPLLTGEIPSALCQLNGTCTFVPLNPRKDPGLSFDCVSTGGLCGCDCTCSP